MTIQLKRSDLEVGCWHLNTDFVPPENIRVLCCSQDGQMWFDTFDVQWHSPVSPDLFGWQLIETPIDLF